MPHPASISGYGKNLACLLYCRQSDIPDGWKGLNPITCLPPMHRAFALLVPSLGEMLTSLPLLSAIRDLRMSLLFKKQNLEGDPLLPNSSCAESCAPTLQAVAQISDTTPEFDKLYRGRSCTVGRPRMMTNVNHGGSEQW